MVDDKESLGVERLDLLPGHVLETSIANGVLNSAVGESARYDAERGAVMIPL